MIALLPPAELQARLPSKIAPPASYLPELCSPELDTSRRKFLIGAAAFMCSTSALANTGSQLIFSPDTPEQGVPSSAVKPPPTAIDGLPQQVPQALASPELGVGEIPPDFWLRPRELWLYRKPKKGMAPEAIKVVYWKDGHLISEGYWQICALMRDVHVNKMTYMDPALFDILRGIFGFYQAWRWNQPLVINSGFRTLATNNKLISEGAAKNSRHLYGQAADIYMPGIPVSQVAALGLHFKRGGVGFYPSDGFVHLDTGKIRAWRGK